MRFRISRVRLSMITLGIFFNPSQALPGPLTDVGPLGDLEYIGPIEAGGANVSLFGTAESIYNQIIAINPEFANSDFGLGDNHLSTSNQQEVSAWPPNCNGSGQAKASAIRTGVSYLHKLGFGSCCEVPGPGKCTRVSCSWNSGIYFCNDATVRTCVPCTVLGDFAGGIVDYCAKGGEGVWGQLFDISGVWNVIVSLANAYGDSGYC